jgi:tRNA dimethylallyltransferase
MENVTERRVIRALEMYQLTGVPMSVHRSRKIEIEYEFVQYMLQWERAELYNRINNRVDKMLESGLINEITALKDKGLHYSTLNSLNTVGVREVFDHLDGKITYEKMTELIKQNSRRYAKRQLTWFRRDENILNLEPKTHSVSEIVDLSIS